MEPGVEYQCGSCGFPLSHTVQTCPWCLAYLAEDDAPIENSANSWALPAILGAWAVALLLAVRK
jgi:hypothetical protein